MSRIQIPLDIIMSRLNLSDRFAGVRSQSIAARFANLRPVSEFFDFKRLSKPANFGEIQSRVNYNLGHFSSNYAVVFSLLSIYSLLTSWLLVFVIVLVVGGMWGIGKLDGQDLDIGVIRATSSQLYTGLLILVVPLSIIVIPKFITTILWLIGASGVSFFRGGGLAGRPRSPKSVPSWGRPPGAKESKWRKAWEREQAEWGQRVRVEELDSDETDTQGVGANFSAGQFSSDPLQFTGLDLASNFRSRRSYVAPAAEESSEDSEDSDDSEMQVAMRDKEEALVQSALARIRRAQEKGKQEVKLNQDELDALERRRKRMQAAATAKARKGSASSGGSGSERKRRTITVPIALAEPIVQPTGRKRSKSHRPEEYSAYPAAATNPPGMLVAGPDGLTFAPVGYYPPQSSGRPRSATYQQQAAPVRGSLPPSAHRNFSDGTRPTSSSSTSRRPLPDEVEWLPTKSRRSSGSSQHLMDPFDYQVSPGHPPSIPTQYIHPQAQYQNQNFRDVQQGGGNRRNVSSPADVAYSSIRRSPPGAGYPAQAARIPTSNSDPALRQRRSTRGEEFRDETYVPSSSEDDQDDDLGNGVQVYVEEPVLEKEKEKEKPVSRKPVSSRKKGKR